MKRIALFATTALILAACGAKEEAPVAMDSATAAPAAAAPAMMDSTAMTHDSTAMAAPAMDSGAMKH